MSLKSFNILSLKHLSEVSKIDYNKLINNIKGRYNSLTDQEKTHLYNCIRTEVEKGTLWLGYNYEGRKVKN